MNETNTHILVIKPGTSPIFPKGAEIPVVVGAHDLDWDVCEEMLKPEGLAQLRQLLKSRQPATDDGKPIGVRNTDIQRSGAEIRLKGEQVMALPTVDQVVAKYIETRDEIKRRQAELDEELKVLKEYQAKREQWLLGELNKIGAKNVKTPHGTVYQTTTESVTMGDWDSFFNYVQETQQFNLLTHAVNKTAALEIMGEERQNALPPGVNYVAIRTVNVRKS